MLNIYFNPSATGSNTGDSWENAFVSSLSVLSTIIDTSDTDIHVYLINDSEFYWGIPLLTDDIQNKSIIFNGGYDSQQNITLIKSLMEIPAPEIIQGYGIWTGKFNTIVFNNIMLFSLYETQYSSSASPMFIFGAGCSLTFNYCDIFGFVYALYYDSNYDYSDFIFSLNYSSLSGANGQDDIFISQSPLISDINISNGTSATADEKIYISNSVMTSSNNSVSFASFSLINITSSLIANISYFNTGYTQNIDCIVNISDTTYNNVGFAQAIGLPDINNASLIMDRVTIFPNSSPGFALYTKFKNNTITNCVFDSNYTHGIELVTPNNLTITNLILTNCILTNVNDIVENGTFIVNDSNIRLIDCTFAKVSGIDGRILNTSPLALNNNFKGANSSILYLNDIPIDAAVNNYITNRFKYKQREVADNIGNMSTFDFVLKIDIISSVSDIITESAFLTTTPWTYDWDFKTLLTPKIDKVEYVVPKSIIDTTSIIGSLQSPINNISFSNIEYIAYKKFDIKGISYDYDISSAGNMIVWSIDTDNNLIKKNIYTDELLGKYPLFSLNRNSLIKLSGIINLESNKFLIEKTKEIITLKDVTGTTDWLDVGIDTNYDLRGILAYKGINYLTMVQMINNILTPTIALFQSNSNFIDFINNNYTSFELNPGNMDPRDLTVFEDGTLLVANTEPIITTIPAVDEINLHDGQPEVPGYTTTSNFTVKDYTEPDVTLGTFTVIADHLLGSQVFNSDNLLVSTNFSGGTGIVSDPNYFYKFKYISGTTTNKDTGIIYGPEGVNDGITSTGQLISYIWSFSRQYDWARPPVGALCCRIGTDIYTAPPNLITELTLPGGTNAELRVAINDRYGPPYSVLDGSMLVTIDKLGNTIQAHTATVHTFSVSETGDWIDSGVSLNANHSYTISGDGHFGLLLDYGSTSEIVWLTQAYTFIPTVDIPIVKILYWTDDFPITYVTIQANTVVVDTILATPDTIIPAVPESTVINNNPNIFRYKPCYDYAIIKSNNNTESNLMLKENYTEIYINQEGT